MKAASKKTRPKKTVNSSSKGPVGKTRKNSGQSTDSQHDIYAASDSGQIVVDIQSPLLTQGTGGSCQTEKASEAPVAVTSLQENKTGSRSKSSESRVSDFRGKDRNSRQGRQDIGLEPQDSKTAAANNKAVKRMYTGDATEDVKNTSDDLDSMSEDSNVEEDTIGQVDGCNDLNELSEDETIDQLDGSYDGFYKISRHSLETGYQSVVQQQLDSIKTCITVLTSTHQSDTSQGTRTVPQQGTIPASEPSGLTGSRQIKRDRSVSDDSNEGGDHPAKKKHQCHICNKLFPNSFRLKTHVRVHTGEKPFKCEPCCQAFADRSNYVKHKQTKTHKNKVDLVPGGLTDGTSKSLVTAGPSSHPAFRYASDTRSSLIVSHSRDNSREVPQFDFLDSPTSLNQHDLDCHVPIDGYDTDDSLPMTFEDMDDVSLAAEYYMFSSQVDGEQDLLEMTQQPAPRKLNGPMVSTNILVNGGLVQRQVNGAGEMGGGAIKIEPTTMTTTMVVNGTDQTPLSESSILARHLGMLVTKAPSESTIEHTFSCDMCSAKLKNKRNFETHMKRHRGELPFKCEECPKTFQGRRDLDTHKRSRHDQGRRTGGSAAGQGEESMELCQQPMLLSPIPTPQRPRTIVLSMNNLNNLPSSLMTDNMNTVLIKQDPVMVANHKDEPPDTDFILQDSGLALFDNSLMESSDSAVNLSLDDLTNFAQPLGGSMGSSSLQPDNSFDTSMDDSTSFLSGADMSTDTFDLVGDSASESGYNRRTPSIIDLRSESGGLSSPFTPRSDSGTPSLPDEGEFPCPQCDKRFGNRRNLMSHMRRHTGDYKLFCESCGKGFFTQSKLDSHKRKHTGEKPFRCLYSTCLKRFRYKGDLSKHIKRYHPGHSQALTPVPLQEDEMAALANAQQAAKQKVSLVIGHSMSGISSAGHVSTSSSTSQPVSTLRTVLTTGLRPSQLVVQQTNSSMQPPAYKLQTGNNSSNPGTIIPDSDPSLDENLLNMLAADGEDEDDPMLSPSTTAKTLAGLSQSNTALVLPNTVFSSKGVSAQEVGVFLQSSGKSSDRPHSMPVQLNSKAVILNSNRVVQSGSPSSMLTPRSRQFALPQTTNFAVVSPAAVSCQTIRSSGMQQTVTLASLPGPHFSTASTSSSQTLRSLLSSTPEGLPVTQTMRLAPLQPRSLSHHVPGTNTVLTPSFSPSTGMENNGHHPNSPKMTESFLPADISFMSRGDGSEEPSLPSDAVSLTLDDIMSYAHVPPLKDHLLTSSGGGSTVSDRESDLTSPGSVRSELEGSLEGEVGDKVLTCQFPGCGRNFDRPNLLKRHIKMHSGESRFVCDVCKKSFESGSKLEDHYRRHTGERPFQCHICGNKFRYKGDRTKHLKNLHGITKAVDGTSAIVLTNGGLGTEALGCQKSTVVTVQTTNSNATDNTPFLPSITEETSSSISSFHSNPESQSDMAGAGSASGGSTVESPTKFDPLDVGPPGLSGPALTTSSSTSNLNNNGSSSLSRLVVNGRPPPLSLSHSLQETVTMSIDEVMQYAQPIADFTF